MTMEAANIAAGLTNLDRPLAMSAIHGPCCKATFDASRRETKKPRKMIPGASSNLVVVRASSDRRSLAANHAEDSQSPQGGHRAGGRIRKRYSGGRRGIGAAQRDRV